MSDLPDELDTAGPMTSNEQFASAISKPTTFGAASLNELLEKQEFIKTGLDNNSSQIKEYIAALEQQEPRPFKVCGTGHKCKTR